MGSIQGTVLLGLAACGRIGIEPASDAAPRPGDGAIGDGTIGDGATIDAPPGSLAGVYTLDSPITFTCAAGLVDIGVTTFTFGPSGSMLAATSDDAGATQQPCVMLGPTPTGTAFDVTCTLPGACAETYRLMGTITGAKTWTGTFTATFTGMCLGCTMQSFPRTGTTP